MDISTIAFIIVSFGSLVLAFIIEGGNLVALLAGTAAMIVFGGTIGAVGVSFPMKTLKKIPKMFKVIIKPGKFDLPELVALFKEISYKTRRNGLLSLESEIGEEKSMDPYIRKGLQLVVDGIDPESVRAILELEAECTSERHREGYAVFNSAGGLAPTMGVIGTVMGLVHVLGNLSDPAALGPEIAVAFIATLYGVGSANLLWLPLGAKLKVLDAMEYKQKSLIIEAILLIQEGANPNTISEKLKGFLDKEEIKKYEELEKAVAE
jgi:chemotaxis protein MotA